MRRYDQVVRLLQQQIDSGALKVGERLPSIRETSAATGYSMVTVQHAYEILQGEGLIRSQPRSGFYVAQPSRPLAEFAALTKDEGVGDLSPVAASSLAYKIPSRWARGGLEPFGSLLPGGDLFPAAEIDLFLRARLRRKHQASPAPNDPNAILREAVARRLTQRGSLVSPANVVLTRGALHALNLCLDVVTRAGDLVLVESPSFFPLLSLLEQRNLKVLEIYSHPKTGIDPDQFDHLLSHNEVTACVLMPISHYPTGVTYQPDIMARIVATARQHKVPIIENDMYAELSYSGVPPNAMKSLDSSDNILQFGSFETTLGPGCDVGWVVSGRHREALERRAFFDDRLDGAPRLIEQALAQYLTRRSYDRQLRHVRETVAARMRRGLALVAEYFPHNCAASRPVGGAMCWIRGPKEFDALSASRRALHRGIALAPGPIFSVTSSFRNFIGLNLSVPWTAEREQKLRVIGELLGRPSGP
ncbi:MAG TPA: PLP-dependent aminotransferase family protein [Pseudolabrys sp.]|nr:PLP-dependent aminotransferase family protein [Pseudolabrys sp.]